MIVLPRRRFLMGPAIVAATSLMPGHSIAKLLAPPPRDFAWVLEDPMSHALDLKSEARVYWGYPKPLMIPVRATAEEARLFSERLRRVLVEWRRIPIVREDILDFSQEK